MHNGNWFAVSRMMFEHYVVGAGHAVAPDDPSRGAYSKMEAWLDLIAMAAYEKTAIMNKGREQEILPGQLMGAHTYLARRWNWTVKTVRVFVRQLELCEMITRAVHEIRDKRDGNQKGNQCQVITISNYGNYQLPSDFQGQAKGQAEGQAEGKRGASEGQARGTNLTSKQPNNKQETPMSADADDHELELKDGRVTSAEIDALAAFNAYNDMALRLGLPQARTLTPGRRKALKARLREHGGMPAWEQALANVERSAYLRGNNKNNWSADFDFLLQASRFAKVVDGTYGNGAHAAAMPVDKATRHARVRGIVEQVMSRKKEAGK